MKPTMVHVLPVNDTMMHEEDGEYCHCNPTVERHDYGTVVIHNAFDGREFSEDDGRSVKQ